MNKNYKGRGGKREGAGRPATGQNTKVMRVPKDFPTRQQLENLLEIIEDWENRIEAEDPTSPRWWFARQMINDLKSALEE